MNLEKIDLLSPIKNLARREYMNISPEEAHSEDKRQEYRDLVIWNTGMLVALTTIIAIIGHSWTLWFLLPLYILLRIAYHVYRAEALFHIHAKLKAEPEDD